MVTGTVRAGGPSSGLCLALPAGCIGCSLNSLVCVLLLFAASITFQSVTVCSELFPGSETAHAHTHEYTLTNRGVPSTGRPMNVLSSTFSRPINLRGTDNTHTTQMCTHTHTCVWCCLLNRDAQKRKVQSKEKDIVRAVNGLTHKRTHTQIPLTLWFGVNHMREQDQRAHGGSETSCYMLAGCVCAHVLVMLWAHKSVCSHTVRTRPQSQDGDFQFKVQFAGNTQT